MKGKVKFMLSFVIFSILLLINGTNVYADENGQFVDYKGESSWSSYTCGSFLVKNLNIDGVDLNGRRMYCTEHRKTTPNSNSWVTAKVYYPGMQGYNKSVAAILYHAPQGSTDSHEICAVSLALNKLCGDDGKPKDGSTMANNALYKQYMSYANNQDCPEGTAYVLLSTGDSNKQILGAYWGIKQSNGTIAMRKTDLDGNPIAGARFHITGDGVDEYRESILENNGWVYLEVPQGTYWIEEVDAPYGMVNKSDDSLRRQEKLVQAGGQAEFSRANAYQRGSVRLVKYDADNEGNTKGDATLEGAVFRLYAAQEIKEGNKTIYTANQFIKEVTTDVNGNTEEIGDLPLGRYYYQEATAPRGFKLNNDFIEVNIEYQGQEVEYVTTEPVRVGDAPIYGRIRIVKRLAGLAHDPEQYLPGAQFRAVLVSDETQVYYSNVTGDDGVCVIDNIPYGEYRIEECVVPDSANPITSFNIMVEKDKSEYTYGCELLDSVKSMKIEINKHMLLKSGEKTDAKLSGAVFTIYRDAQCRNKVCEITPTNENGYAISEEIKTGTYYLKETTFPVGVDPDAVISGENVTYRNKVYVVSADNKAQGKETVTKTLNVVNEPKRHDTPVYKSIEATSNTPKFPLDKCEFTATLKSSIGTDHVFSRKCTAQTDANGYCIIEDLPYGEYVIEETKVSPISLKCENFTVFVQEDRKVKTEPYTTYVTDVAKKMYIKIRKVDANRVDSDPIDYTQGDAKLKGAIYEIYRYDPQTDAYTEKAYDITVDHKDSDGYWCAESRDLLVGKYMVKEKIKYSETIDNVTYNYSYAEGYLADTNEYYFDQNPETQTVERTYHKDVSKEEVIRGAAYVVKYDNQTEESSEVPSQGAILRLTLDSSLNTDNPIYYDVKIDDKGYGEFIDKNDDMHTTSIKSCYGEKYYPYTIPYGKYTITEVRESDHKLHTSFYIKPENVIITKQTEKQYRIEADEPIPFIPRIEKEDADTGARVALAGATFKIWNVEENSWVEQMSYSDGGLINEFKTNNDGYLMTPEKLIAGEYIIYEVKAPVGYYLEDEFRIPQKESDIGKKDKGGKYINVTKSAMGIAEDIIANKKDYIYTVSVSDRPLVTRLQIYKTGEMLTGVATKTTEYGELYTPTYKESGLKGVTYEIRSSEDIKSPDGNVTYVTKGTLVDTITTNDEGIATTIELYPGEYEIKETITPQGYIKEDNIPNVVLESSKNELKRVQDTNLKLSNKRQKLGLTFPKRFDEIKYKLEEDYVPEATFAVYANEDIKTNQNNIVIPKNGLVDLITIREDGDVTTNVDLPKGKYYVEEVATKYPYTINPVHIEFELNYSQDNKQEFNIVSGDVFTNEVETATITLIKVSTSSMKSVLIDGNKVDYNSIEDDVKSMVKKLQNMTKEQVEQYFKENNIKSVSGATYGIYLDEKCTNILKVQDEVTKEFKEAIIITDESGMITLEEIPLGEYYIKELVAPKGYEASNDIIKVTLTAEQKDETVYAALMEDKVVNGFIKKTDIFDGDVVPNCVFSITDDKGNEILRSKTSDEGIAYIPADALENGKNYFFTEIEAPKMYELNTEPHPFTAQIEQVDEELVWTGEVHKVENTRKSKELRVLKVDDETGEPLKGCVFSIVLLDENGEPKTREDGSVVYLVENGVTDENGEYLIEKAYYGTYKFTEIEAPEGYEMNEESMEGYVFTIDENSPDRIDFIVTNTGDIAVIAISSILLISIVGIVYTLRKKYNEQ